MTRVAPPNLAELIAAYGPYRLDQLLIAAAELEAKHLHSFDARAQNGNYDGDLQYLLTAWLERRFVTNAADGATKM